MTTLFNSVAARFAVAFVAVAMAFTLVAPVVSAEGLDDMSLEDLIALVNQLQSQVGQGDDMMTGGSCSYTWTRSLSTGSTGADVMDLQKFLNMDPDTQIAASGAGSPGAETSYYGGLTAAAVSKFQTKYSADILVPVGLVNPTGYFGPSTMAKANSVCSSMTDGGDDMDDSDDSDDSSDDDDNTLGGGEADVRNVDASDEEDEANEGEEDVPVISVEFDVEDGDAQLERMDVRFDNTNIAGDAEDEPWDVFEEISIWVDGDKVASEDATDEDDWDEDGAEFEFRLTNIDEIFREDTTGEVVVAVSIANGVDVDATGGNNEWIIDIPQDGMRFVDGEGLDIEVPSAAAGTDNAAVQIQEAGSDAELDLRTSSEDPDATTLEIDEDNETEHMFFAFELDADDSEGDISLDNFVSVDVCVGGTEGTSLDNFIDDFRIEIDGESFDAEGGYDGDDLCAVIDFDVDGDVVIDEGSAVDVLVYANFDDAGNSFTSATIWGNATTTDIDAEDEASGENVTVGGTDRGGEVHTVRTSGLNIGAVTDGDGSGDAEHTENETTADNSYGEFFLTFEVTAFGEDAYVPMGSTTRSATADDEAGVTYTIETASTSAAQTDGSVSITYDVDGADEEGDYFFLEEGETYEMTVSINSFNPVNPGTFNFQLISIGFTDEESGPDIGSEPVTPLNDYESDDVFITS